MWTIGWFDGYLVREMSDGGVAEGMAEGMAVVVGWGDCWDG